MRRILLKLIILGVLILFMPITFMLRRWQKSAGQYQWKDTFGENIPLPDEVRGQTGSEVCASSDGQIIVVAGNRVIPQNIFEGKNIEPALTLLGYKYFIYASKSHGRDFECVYRSPSPGVVTRMALSPLNSHRLAFIAAEFQTTVPETANELAQMSRDSKKRAELANEYATALQAKDLHLGLYILDTDKKEPPRMLCPLDNYPQKRLLGMPKADLSRYNEFQLKLLNEMKSFRESGIYLPWKVRLKIEKETKSIAWTLDGNTLLVKDGFFITKIDLSGNQSPFYAAPEGMTVTSNTCCCVNGDVLFVETARKMGRVDDERNNEFVYLVRLDRDGNIITKTRGAFIYSTPLFFDESIRPLVGEHKIATACNKIGSMHDAFLRTASLPPIADGWGNTVDWKDHSKTYDIHDPNHVQFYYMPKAFLNNGEEILFFKRRAYVHSNPRGYPYWEATPWTVENADAPWVELRKMKIH
jgi:hypothetical protein